MSKTADLKKLITARLNTANGGTYYRKASSTTVYPYKTFEFTRAYFEDQALDDFDLCIDIWDHDDSPAGAEALADDVEALFNEVNLPQLSILPTFWRASRYFVADDDKTIQHIQLHFDVQMYTS
jgi:hypothetical protein